MRSIVVLMVLGLGSVACHPKVYIGPELPEVSPSDVNVPETRRPVNLEIACSFGDELLPQVGIIWSKAYREAVYTDFRERRCGQFRSVVQEVFGQYASILPAENVDRLVIKLDVRRQDQGRVTMEAEFTPVARPPLRREYKGTLYYGRAPTGARPLWEMRPMEPPPDFSLTLVRDMTLNLVRDLQQGGEL